MLRRIVLASAQHRYLVLFLTAVALFTAWLAIGRLRLDALPDLSETQVILMTRWERSPDILEDQVTYPLVSALTGTAKVKTVRGISDFGYSYVYVIFEDGTDLYWARSRVLEKISTLRDRLPAAAEITTGPDASSIGWVYQYALRSTDGKVAPAELRAFQDFTLRYVLQSVPGVAEVAAVGGFRKQYQIQVNPVVLSQLQISLTEVAQAVREANNEGGARLIELAGAEYMIRMRGYLGGLDAIRRIAVRTENGTPVTLEQIARISEEPELRRGIAAWGADPSVVGGIVVMRQGESALNVINRVKERLAETRLPEGVELITVYDRSEFIKGAIDHLIMKLIEEMLIVSLVIMLFLWHFPSAVVPVLTIPISVLLSFIPFYLTGTQADIMSLSGMAISIGVLVDGAVIEVENAYRKLQEWQSGQRQGDWREIRMEALAEVAPSVFYSLLVIAVAFLPIFALTEMEGRLFKPLAFAKNFTMVIAALLVITVDPAIRMFFSRMEPFQFHHGFLNHAANAIFVGRYYREEQHPISRVLFRMYDPVCRISLRYAKQTVVAAVLLAGLSVFLFMRLGSEFMPPLWEGSLLYMPTTVPGLSAPQAEKLLVAMHERLMQQQEVKQVFGKAGRAETATDPAPLSMIETVIELHPPERWRQIKRFYSHWPSWLQTLMRFISSDRISREDLLVELDKALKFTGVSNAMTMPIKARVDMLSTGFRTPIGIKVQGGDVLTLQNTALAIERLVREKLKPRGIFAERVTGGYYLDIEPDRDALARYGLSLAEFQRFIETAVGGETLTVAIEGRERYNIALRYPREWRDSRERLAELPLTIAGGATVRLRDLAVIKTRSGAAMLRNENGLLTVYVFIDPGVADLGGYVDHLKALIDNSIQLPAGVQLSYGGQFENMQRTRETLATLLPLTALLVIILIYMNTKKLWKTALVLSAVPFSLLGAAVLLHLAGYQMSVAVWVGIIALVGLDAETGIFMLLYLDLSYDEAKQAGRLRNQADLKKAVLHGAVHRLRPKMMTVISAIAGLTPILWSDGLGADLMKRVALPMVGGLISSFVLELLIYPPVYYLVRQRELTHDN